jgi:hypothetical protein
MNQELKQKWIEALRSGKYIQGQGALRSVDEDEYCCLGVLCEYLPNVRWENGDDSNYTAVLFNELGDVTRSTLFLPGTLNVDLGLNILIREDGDSYTIYSMLMYMNDEGKNFNEIADYIERYL